MMVEDVGTEKLAIMTSASHQNTEKAEPKTSGREAVVFGDLLAQQEVVFRICLGFSRNYAEAQDLAQDVYLKAYLSLGALENPAVSKEWLFRIAKNTCLDHQKKMRLRRVLLLKWGAAVDEPDSPEAAPDLKKKLQRLKSEVRRLPKKLRAVFILREYGHLAYDEIAAALGIKEGTVMSRLNRARTAVRRRLKERSHEKE